MIKNIHFRTRSLLNFYELLDNQGITPLQKAVFKSLFKFFDPIINSIYFQVANFGDGKYKLVIRKDMYGEYDVKFSINEDYKNPNDIWT